VLGAMIANVHWSGELRTLRNSACAVWAKQDENWRLVAYQPTPILT
jgi:hypothetical protein